MFNKLIRKISVKATPDFQIYLEALDDDELMIIWRVMKDPYATSGGEALKMVKRETERRFNKDISKLL